MEDLIHQVLSTTLGERIKQPDFGCGLPRLIFSPISKDIGGLIQFLVREGLDWAELVGRRIYGPHARLCNVMWFTGFRVCLSYCVPLSVPVRTGA